MGNIANFSDYMYLLITITYSSFPHSISNMLETAFKFWTLTHEEFCVKVTLSLLTHIPPLSCRSLVRCHRPLMSLVPSAQPISSMHLLNCQNLFWRFIAAVSGSASARSHSALLVVWPVKGLHILMIFVKSVIHFGLVHIKFYL